MIKLRKYFKGHNSIYVHGTVKGKDVTGKDVTLRSTPDRPEWVSEDIDLPKPVSLYRYEWSDVHNGSCLAVTFNLSEIEKDGTVRYGDWFNTCTVNSRDCIKDPVLGMKPSLGPFFCLVVDGTEYWHDDVEENFARLQSRIGDYNTELYLKEIDEQGTV